MWWISAGSLQVLPVPWVQVFGTSAEESLRPPPPGGEPVEILGIADMGQFTGDETENWDYYGYIYTIDGAIPEGEAGAILETIH